MKWVGQSYEKQGLVWKSLSEMNGDLLVLESLSNDSMLLDVPFSAKNVTGAVSN